MKALISIVLIVVMFLAARNIVQRWNEVERRQSGPVAPPKVVAAPVLPGLPDRMEEPLQEAIKKGPPAVKAFLDKYASHIQDPRRGDVELDYAVSINRSDLAEARQIYKAVKARTPTNSPLAPRLEKLRSTYE